MRARVRVRVRVKVKAYEIIGANPTGGVEVNDSWCQPNWWR